MDILQEHLVRARAAGGVFARSVALPPWGLRLPGSIQLAVHAMIQGHGWLWTDSDREPVELRPGDLAFVRGGQDHFIAHAPGARCVEPESFKLHHPAGDAGADPRAAVFLCGAYRFAGDIGAGLVDAMPPVFLIPCSVNDPIRDVVSLLSREMANAEPGRQMVLDRLLDVLVVLGLRSGLACSDNPPPWFRAAADPRLSSALQAMHEHAGKPWTVDELAALSHMSRAAFARIFQQALGQAPMQYLTEWRMAVARDLLSTQDVSLSDVAERVGYASLNGFVTAFHRLHGQPPGRWRERGHPTPAATVAH